MLSACKVQDETQFYCTSKESHIINRCKSPGELQDKFNFKSINLSHFEWEIIVGKDVPQLANEEIELSGITHY